MWAPKDVQLWSASARGILKLTVDGSSGSESHSEDESEEDNDEGHSGGGERMKEAWWEKKARRSGSRSRPACERGDHNASQEKDCRKACCGLGSKGKKKNKKSRLKWMHR